MCHFLALVSVSVTEYGYTYLRGYSMVESHYHKTPFTATYFNQQFTLYIFRCEVSSLVCANSQVSNNNFNQLKYSTLKTSILDPLAEAAMSHTNLSSEIAILSYLTVTMRIFIVVYI